MLVLSGNANRPLADSICRYIDVPLGRADVTQFSDGETRVEIHDNVRGRDIFIVQPLCRPVNHHIMEALILADACRRSSAYRVTLVAPYFGYARQERKNSPRAPISAKLVADLLTAAGFDRLLALELHTSAIQGFFNIPVDHLFAKPLFAGVFGQRPDSIVVSPDAGGVERARAMAKHLACGLAIVDKRRDRPNESSVMNIIGDVSGLNAIIIDDIVDTAGSLTQAADALTAAGAKSVIAAVSHAVLSGPAVERIVKSSLTELYVTNSIPLSSAARGSGKIVEVDIAEFLGKAMRRIHHSESVSSLFV